MKQYFAEVVGYDAIKEELYRILDVMRNPERYRELGVKLSRGLILSGEPGVGKTLLCNCFIKASGWNSFILRKNKSDGEFIKYVNNVFEKAKNKTPSIVFLDDLDKFSSGDDSYGEPEEYAIIQSNIDDCKESEVFVLATANNTRSIPHSLLREGRFDRHIKIEPPTVNDAELIAKYYLQKKKISSDLDYREIAKLLNGRSCAALETVINEAGIYAGRSKKKCIGREDIIKAFLRDVYGVSESIGITKPEYIKAVSVHEAGHIVISEVLEPESVNIATINLNSRDMNGQVSYEATEDEYFSLRHYENKILRHLGGKAATEVVFGKVDLGSISDVQEAVKLIGRIADDFTAYGFGAWMTGLGPENVESKMVLDKKALTIQSELERYYHMTKRLLTENREFLESIAAGLAKKGTLAYQEIQQIKSGCTIIPFCY